MPDTVMLCLDHVETKSRGGLDPHVDGWCLGSGEILALQAKFPAGLFPVRYPDPRPDVALALPHASQAGRSGFYLTLPPDVLPAFSTMDLIVTLRDKGIFSRTLLAKIRLVPGRVQKVNLRPVTDPAVALPQSRSVEKRLKAYLNKNPGLTLRLDITNKCNLRCVMCHCSHPKFRSQKPEMITAGEFKAYFEPIRRTAHNVMLSCAFEPLLSPHLPAILAYLGKIKPALRIGLCSNAMLLNARLRRVLLEAGVTYALFSMDGATKKTLERIRRGSNYERVVSNLLALRDLKIRAKTPYPLVTMNYVLMESNLEEAPAFVRLCARLGVRSIDFRHLVPGRFFKLPKESLRHSPGKYNYYRKWILALAREVQVEVSLPSAFDGALVWKPGEADLPPVGLEEFERVAPDPAGPEKIRPKRFPADFSPAVNNQFPYKFFPGIACHHPFSEIRLANKNQVFPCPNYQEELGLISAESGLKDIFFGKKFQQARLAMFAPGGGPACRDCPVKKNYFAGP